MVTTSLQRIWAHGHEQITKSTRQLYRANANLHEVL